MYEIYLGFRRFDFEKSTIHHGEANFTSPHAEPLAGTRLYVVTLSSLIFICISKNRTHENLTKILQNLMIPYNLPSF